MKREWGPVAKRLGDDPGAAGPYINIARTLLGKLVAHAQRGNLQYLVRRWKLVDGTLITAVTDHGRNTFTIIPPRPDPLAPPTPSCGSMIHGLLRTTDEGSYYRSVESTPEDEERGWLPIEPKMESTRLAASGATGIRLLPGLYCGEMRKVVQDKLSRGRDVPFSYTYAKSHGIYTDIQRNKWVIEISTTTGIRAQLLNLCKETPYTRENSIADLGYIPGAGEFGANPQARPVITLMPPTMFASSIRGAALFPQCGWAFSASGSKAANTLWRTKMVNGEEHLYTETFVIDIIITPTVAGPSGAATVTAVNEGYAYGNRIEHMKYPDYAAGKLQSLDHWGVRGDPAPTIDTIYHCWYDGEDLQELRRYKSPTVTTTDSEGYTDSRSYSGFTSPAYPATDEDLSLTGNPDPDLVSWAVMDSTGNLEYCFGTGENHCYRAATYKKTLKYSRNRSERYYDVPIIPFYDREGIYHAKLYEMRDAWNETTKNKVWPTHLLGAFGSQCINDDPVNYPGDRVGQFDLSAPPACNEIYFSGVNPVFTDFSGVVSYGCQPISRAYCYKLEGGPVKNGPSINKVDETAETRFKFKVMDREPISSFPTVYVWIEAEASDFPVINSNPVFDVNGNQTDGARVFNYIECVPQYRYYWYEDLNGDGVKEQYIRSASSPEAAFALDSPGYEITRIEELSPPDQLRIVRVYGKCVLGPPQCNPTQTINRGYVEYRAAKVRARHTLADSARLLHQTPEVTNQPRTDSGALFTAKAVLSGGNIMDLPVAVGQELPWLLFLDENSLSDQFLGIVADASDDAAVIYSTDISSISEKDGTQSYPLADVTITNSIWMGNPGP
jgi:hypothetical protein